jgi:hypothetical protein
MNVRRFAVVMALTLLSAPARAQDADVRAQLTARGLPSELSDQVAAIAAEAAARGIPTGPLLDKAIEGWSKHVSDVRIVGAVRLLSGRLADAREAVLAAGLASPSAEVVAAAAEAMGRGIGEGQVGAVVRAARAPAAAAPGLSVAAALVAEGLPSDQAVAVVVDAMRAGRPISQILDLPSTARAMESQGMTPGDIGREMLHGEGRHDEAHRGGERGGRMPDLPPPPGVRPPRRGRGGPGRP